MYSKEDFTGYFNQIKNIEIKMKTVAEELMADLEDERLIAMMKIIHDDEERHEKIVDEILSFF